MLGMVLKALLKFKKGYISLALGINFLAQSYANWISCVSVESLFLNPFGLDFCTPNLSRWESMLLTKICSYSLQMIKVSDTGL